MMFRAMWDAKDGSPRPVEGWVRWEEIVLVERSGRDRLSPHGHTVAEPLAIVTLTSGATATVAGQDAARLFRLCELETRHSPVPPRPPVTDLDDLRCGGLGDMAAA